MYTFTNCARVRSDGALSGGARVETMTSNIVQDAKKTRERDDAIQARDA